MPLLFLGLPGDNTFANYGEAKRAFWRQTVLPLVGYESYRRRFHDKVIIRETFGVAVIIRRAPKLRKGYIIISAFPINR
jgi:phage portal protein BeeE